MDLYFFETRDRGTAFPSVPYGTLGVAGAIIESRGMQRELPQTVSKVRPAVTMATAWHPRGIRVDESERGKHEEMTSYLDKLAGKQLDLLDKENTREKLNKFQYQTVQ